MADKRGATRMIGQTLGHYRIVEKLGEGGMGVVYRARDEHLNRDVAIKVLPEDVAHDPERLARFKREAQLLASLNHPNIAAIYGLEEQDGLRYLVLEYVPGQTLAERVGAQGRGGGGDRPAPTVDKAPGERVGRVSNPPLRRCRWKRRWRFASRLRKRWRRRTKRASSTAT